MPQASTGQNDQQNSMAQSMKTMNMMMPIMSAFFCFTLPAGMGVYWIAGSVVRSIQQVIINRHIDKIDIDELINKNVEKKNKKLEKAGIDPNTLNKNASLNTRNINTSKSSMSSKAQVKSMSQNEREEALKKSTEYYNKNAIKRGRIVELKEETEKKQGEAYLFNSESDQKTMEKLKVLLGK